MSSTVPVIGVVEPGARAAMRTTASKVDRRDRHRGHDHLAARTSARSTRSSPTRSSARACPLFVPLVEEGWTDHEATRLVASEYLEPLVEAQVDTLVLGCTHYPLLKPLLASPRRVRA